MNIEELRNEIVTKTDELAKKIEARDVESAKALKEEIRKTKELLVLAEEQEVEERQALENQKNQTQERGKEMGKVNEMRAVIKSLMGKELTAEERAAIKTVDNSAVIPKQFVNELQEIKKGFGSIKEYCDIIPVTKNEGTIPVVDLDQNTLPEVVEGDNILDGTLVTTELPFKCAKHGLIQPLTSELVDDAEVEIESLVNKNFAEIVTVVENTKILKVVKDNAVAVTGAVDYSDVVSAIDKSLPSVKAGLITVTNVEGYAYLKNVKDTQKRPLNLITEINGKYMFNGKELLVVDDTLLPISEGKSQVFYIVNMKEAVKFCDRKAVTIAKSKEAGFDNDTVKIRILERFAVAKGSTRSIKKIEF
jgi:HK97 family phage major capsid protein